MTDLSGVPQSREAERAVVSAICLDPEMSSVAGGIIRPQDLYWTALRVVYEAILQIMSQGKPATKVEVVEYLKREDLVEELSGLEDLYTGIPSTVEHLEANCEIIADYSALRRTIDVCRQGIAEATALTNDKPVRQIIDEVESAIMGVQGTGRSEKTSARAAELVEDMIERIHTYDGSGVTGINTGYSDFDEMTSGLRGGQLTIVAGRPSMGKTAFAMNVAMNVATKSGNEGEVAIFSLEMDKESLMERLLAAEARVDQKAWRGRNVHPEESKRLGRAVSVIKESSLWIDDRPAQTVLDIRSKCRRLAASPNGLNLVLVDYLQLMRPATSNDRSREQEVAQMSLGLKALARELNVPVVCLSQLSRGPEQRKDKRPMLSDLRESGAIEQDADLVCFLYRPEYYFPDDSKLHGVAELIVAKQRNGPTGRVRLHWHKAYTRFDSSAQKKAGV